jgi:Ring finger domain
MSSDRDYCNLQNVDVITLWYDNVSRTYRVPNNEDESGRTDDTIGHNDVHRVTHRYRHNRREFDSGLNDNATRHIRRRNMEIPTASDFESASKRSLYVLSSHTDASTTNTDIATTYPDQNSSFLLPGGIDGRPATIQVRECTCAYDHIVNSNQYYCSYEFQYCYTKDGGDGYYVPYCFNETLSTSLIRTYYCPFLTVVFVLTLLLMISSPGSLAIGYVLDKIFPSWYNQMTIDNIIRRRPKQSYAMLQRHLQRQIAEVATRERQQQIIMSGGHNNSVSRNDISNIDDNSAENIYTWSRIVTQYQRQQGLDPPRISLADEQLLDFYYPTIRQRQRLRAQRELQSNNGLLKVPCELKTKMYSRGRQLIRSSKNAETSNSSTHSGTRTCDSEEDEKLSRHNRMMHDDIKENSESETKGQFCSDADTDTAKSLENSDSTEGQAKYRTNNACQEQSILSNDENNMEDTRNDDQQENSTETENKDVDDDDEPPMCTICYLDLQDGDRVADIPCQHLFHVDCLKVWLNRRNVCPLCLQCNVASPRIIVTHEQPSETS